jgi:ArsR family transcriptional regulator, arsenate/arsenite/antimonite-responsive transcriptional repressor
MLMSVDTDVAASAILKTLAEPLRWQIVELLAEEELCVCHLVEMLDVAQPLVSHHLRILRDADLVETSKHRYWTYYRLRPNALAALGKQLSALAKAAPPAGRRRRPCC